MKDEHATIGDNVIPINYRLVFVPDFKKFTTKVVENITCKVRKPTKSIKINAKEIKFLSASVFSGSMVQKARIKFNERAEEATFTFSKSVSGAIELSISSICENNEKMYGFYRSKYGAKGKESYLLTTQFEPANARAAFPCFDEPEFKATFDISMIIDSGHDAISNMPIKETSRLDKGKKMVRFEKSLKMSTYLLYLFVGNYDHIDTKLGKLLLRAVTVPGKKEYARISLDYAGRFLDWYQKYFRMKFPIPKLDFLAIPDFAAGAMENWGAITFREIQFYISKESSVALKQIASSTISHEIAHQWFGDLVTMKWWDDLWLNESFATFMADKVLDELFPEWDINLQYVDETIGTALSADALRSTHPISVHVNSPGEIDSIFDRISYDKGGSLLYMLEDYVGKEVFRQGLHDYLSKYAYANASGQDLWNSIQAAARKAGKKANVSDLMHTWVTKSGHPLVDVKKVRGGFKLSQKRFTITGDINESWPIPIHYLTDRGEGILLMDKKEQLVKTSSAFIKLNYGQKGLYRVKYDSATLKELGRLISSKRLRPLDAWGVENDLFSFARSGRIPLSDYLDFVDKYAKGIGYPLNSNIAGHLGWFFSAIYGKKAFAQVKRMVIKFNSQQLGRLGWVAKKGEREIDTMLRGGVIASLGIAEDKETVAKAKSLFDDYVKRGKEIDANIRGAIYSTIAWNFGSANFNFFLNGYKNAKFPEEQRRMISALGGFKDKATLAKSLGISSSSAVRLQDSYIIPMRIASNLNGQELTLKWTMKNWKKFMKLYDSSAHMLSHFVENFSFVDDSKRRAQIVKFFSNKSNMRDDMKLALTQTLERIDANIKFLKKNNL